MSHIITTTRAITALVIISALLVPAASAQPIDPLGVDVATATHAQTNNEIPLGVERASGGANPAAQARPSSPAPTTGATSSGFDWGDAAVGAAGMLIVMGLGAAGFVAVRRSRGHGQPALTS